MQQHATQQRTASLPWERLGLGYYRAEPAPGLVYSIGPAPDGVGVVFKVPGRAEAQAMRASIARVACEHHWQRLAPVVEAPWDTAI
ncbi:hypothetical protein [Halomonas sp. MM17-34]|jgi:hypothetical protein|uniref:hypothetical protein n=1 Tax=Halomonas sp. MM17-34 TaxID=2917742 RepID=UPI001EF615D7|nr:hypothetical protein [Halomonas sp. MM17-34]MCG7605379.1 hypothetical protein [Halomonas sp. MM17-34]